jgi:hypothetical protein
MRKKISSQNTLHRPEETLITEETKAEIYFPKLPKIFD